jgi:hypothetical protein
MTDIAASVQLVMYGRSACHLCDDMREALELLQGEYSFAVEFRDIDSNSDWFDQHALKIPVLMSGDFEICHYYLDMQALQRHFREMANQL